MRNLTNISCAAAILLALLVAGCALDDPTTPTDLNGPGVEDAGARYAAIGNSLTAGYMDGGVMMAGQAGSYPRLIANQLGLDNTGFTQPWIAAPGIGGVNGTTGEVDGIYYFDGVGLARLGSTPLADVQDELLLAATQPTPYENLGVPGARLAEARGAYDAASGAGNPFFDFINRSSFFGNTTVTLAPGLTTESGSMHYKAIAKGGALTTVWLGNNDVLGAATGGNPTTANLTDPAAFQAEYTAMLQSLAGGLLNRNGFPATIVTANIPRITAAAFFLPEAAFDAVVNDQIGASWPGGYEEADVEVVLFTALSFIAANAGNPTVPLPSNYTLTAAEVALVDATQQAYNEIIAGVTAGVNAAGVAKCAMVDMDMVLNSLPQPQKTHFLLLAPQVGVEAAAATTAFSLDGIHPNNVGYGIAANAFIAVINDLDGTSIPAVDLGTLAWDPTYGVPLETKGDGPLLSPEAAEGMVRIFR